MADVHSKEVRSYNMSRIRNKDTSPEMLVRKLLHSKGFRYRLHVKGLPGTPDIVLPRHNLIVFIHGCFWHGHSGCKYFVVPKTRTEWWISKIHRTIILDNQATDQLKFMGWNVVVLWECEIKRNIQDVFKKLLISVEQSF